jgi:hypothetical protein
MYATIRRYDGVDQKRAAELTGKVVTQKNGVVVL